MFHVEHWFAFGEMWGVECGMWDEISCGILWGVAWGGVVLVIWCRFGGWICRLECRWKDWDVAGCRQMSPNVAS